MLLSRVECFHSGCSTESRHARRTPELPYPIAFPLGAFRFDDLGHCFARLALGHLLDEADALASLLAVHIPEADPSVPLFSYSSKGVPSPDICSFRRVCELALAMQLFYLFQEEERRASPERSIRGPISSR